MVSAQNRTIDEAELVNFIRELINAGNDIVYELGQKHQRMMASTIAMMIIDKDFAILSHVGDSRVYVFRDNELSQLTKDHSKLEAIARNQGKKAESNDKAIDRNIITKALGAWPTVEPDIQKVILKDGDIYLLCTDGIYTHNTAEQIRETLRDNPNDLTRVCQTFKENCYAEGAKDHLTAILIKVEKPDRLSHGKKHDLIETVMHKNRSK
jgi:protein phosphatase